MSFRRLPAVFLAAMLVAAGASAASAKPTVKSLGDELICQCGCNQTVNECNHLECSTRSEMRAMMAKDIAAGKDETAILQDFVLRYGVKVLASPPTQGFNIAVWILPGIGMMLGLALLVAIVRRWRKPAAPDLAVPAPVDPKLLAAVEEEMKKVTGS